MSRIDIEVGHILPIYGGVVYITQVDRQEMTVAGRLFPSIEEARLWSHEISLKSHPEWRQGNCRLCAQKGEKK